LEFNGIELTIFWAKVIGSFMVIATASQLARRKKFAEMEKNLYANPGSVANSALIHLLLGLAVVASHNVWELSWRVVITIGGWLFVLKGARRLFSPESDARLAARIDTGNWATLALVGLLLFNLWILYMAFTA
jgi:L-asparagine transporter-like permease